MNQTEIVTTINKLHEFYSKPDNRQEFTDFSDMERSLQAARELRKLSQALRADSKNVRRASRERRAATAGL